MNKVKSGNGSMVIKSYTFGASAWLLLKIAMAGTPEWLGGPVLIGNRANVGVLKISKSLKLHVRCVEAVAARNTDPVRMNLKQKKDTGFYSDNPFLGR